MALGKKWGTPPSVPQSPAPTPFQCQSSPGNKNKKVSERCNGEKGAEPPTEGAYCRPVVVLSPWGLSLAPSLPLHPTTGPLPGSGQPRHLDTGWLLSRFQSPQVSAVPAGRAFTFPLPLQTQLEGGLPRSTRHKPTSYCLNLETWQGLAGIWTNRHTCRSRVSLTYLHSKELGTYRTHVFQKL